MLSVEIDDKKKELLKCQSIAQNVSEQLNKDSEKMRGIGGKQSCIDRELGVSTVLINDISKMKVKRRIHWYLTVLVAFIMTALLLWSKMYRV